MFAGIRIMMAQSEKNKILALKNMQFALGKGILPTCVWPVTIYVSETWTTGDILKYYDYSIVALTGVAGRVFLG